MKKIIVIALAAVMALSLVACGGDKPASSVAASAAPASSVASSVAAK
ncbi:MAG: hypothetical protein RR709_02660 [Ruthenibacterium sp.]